MPLLPPRQYNPDPDPVPSNPRHPPSHLRLRDRWHDLPLVQQIGWVGGLVAALVTAGGTLVLVYLALSQSPVAPPRQQEAQREDTRPAPVTVTAPDAVRVPATSSSPRQQPAPVLTARNTWRSPRVEFVRDTDAPWRLPPSRSMRELSNELAAGKADLPWRAAP